MWDLERGSDGSDDEGECLARSVRVARTEKLEGRVCGDCVQCTYYFYFWGLRQVLWDLERGSDASEDKLTDSCFQNPLPFCDLEW